MTNRPAGFFKRILAALIDFFCVFFILFLGRYICQSSSTFANWFNIEDKYVAINNVVCPSLVDKGLGYISSEEGKPLTCKVYEMNEYIELHFEEYQEKNPNKNENDIKKMIYDDFTKLAEQHDKELDANDIYQKNWKALVDIDNGIFYVFTFVGECIFLFIIPLVNKNHKTIGKYLMKLGLVTTKDLRINSRHVLLYFVGLYGIETVLYSLFLGPDSLIVFGPLISLMVILFSPKRQNIHHMISSTMIIEDKGAVIFDSLEEKEKYDSVHK